MTLITDNIEEKTFRFDDEKNIIKYLERFTNEILY